MKEIDLFYLGCIVFLVILFVIVVFQNLHLRKVEKKNILLKGVVDKLTNENVRLIEELYESNINN